jgi:hypothetical protein
MQHKIKLATFVHTWRGVKESDGWNVDIYLYSCCINMMDLDILEINVKDLKIIKMQTWTNMKCQYNTNRVAYNKYRSTFQFYVYFVHLCILKVCSC